MSHLPPILWEFDGGTLRPANAFMARLADKHMSDGETYRLVEHEERSAKSHNHFFAEVAGLWETLPEHLAERFPSSEHLRKWCLIRAGYCDTASFVASSKAEALRLAAFLRPLDEFSVVTVKDNVVTRYTAHSQSLRAMGKKTFQASKDGVFQQIAVLLGTERRAA